MKAKENKIRKRKGEVTTPTPVASSESLLFAGRFARYEGEQEEEKKQGYNFVTATALLDNVIDKKELTLFSEMETLPTGSTPIDSKLDLVDKKGKRVNLSPRQLKIVLAFSQIVDSVKDSKVIADYIKGLPSKVEWNEARKSPVSATIDVIKLAKHIYGANRIGSKQVDSIRDDLTALSETLQEFKVKDSKGGTLIMEAPLLTLGKRLKYVTKEGVQRLNVVQITLEDIFLYNLNTTGGYQLSPNTILSLWNEQGANSELFSVLLFLLLRVRGNYVKKAKDYSEAKKKELRKDKVPEEEVKKQVEAYKRELLTYRETTYSILERLSGDTYTHKQEKRGKVYTSFRKEKLRTDLQQATDSLKGMGIISDFYTSTSGGGDELCNFVLNPNWLKEQEERQRAILPPEEVKAIDEAIAKEKEEAKQA